MLSSLTKKSQSFAMYWKDQARIVMRIKGRFLISLLRRVLSWLLTKSRLQNTNLPAKLNTFSPSEALD
jgi:hypothetical protein